jgi:antirestriction protein ArdC
LGRKQVGFTEHAQGEVYSREELVAEMGAAFLCQEAGMFDRTEAMNASYIKGWSGFIRNDPKALVVAAGAAQKAVDYLLGRSFEQKSAEPTAEGGA